jgi:hypothetical protein
LRKKLLQQIVQMPLQNSSLSIPEISVASHRDSACARQPVPVRTQPSAARSSLDCYHIRSLLGLPGRPESSHRCFDRSFFSLPPLDSEQWHPWRGLFVLFLCNPLPGSLHACTYGHGRQACKAVYQERPVNMLCTKNDCR